MVYLGIVIYVTFSINSLGNIFFLSIYIPWIVCVCVCDQSIFVHNFKVLSVSLLPFFYPQRKKSKSNHVCILELYLLWWNEIIKNVYSLSCMLHWKDTSSSIWQLKKVCISILNIRFDLLQAQHEARAWRKPEVPILFRYSNGRPYRWVYILSRLDY